MRSLQIDAAVANAPARADYMTKSPQSRFDYGGQASSVCDTAELEHTDSEMSTSSEREPAERLRSTPKRNIHFADAFADIALVEVIEVESLKEATRFTVQDRRNAESEWHQELQQLLSTVSVAPSSRDGLTMRQAAVERILGSCLELALADEAIGSIVVQEALAVGSLFERVALIGELRGSVARLLCSRHGSDVLLACVKLLPKAAGFVAHELEGRARYCVRDPAALSVLCGALRYLPAGQTLALVEETMENLETILEATASGVIDCLLARGDFAEQEKMACRLRCRSQGMCARAQSELARIMDRSP